MSKICIVGMHRSGTSLVSHLLYECGLYLGPREKWDNVAHSNPDGFWENTDFLSINDELLDRFNGGWDFPPTLPLDWHRSPDLKDIRERAEKLVAEFSDQEFWGWKDPRNSLTLPFWRELIPNLKIVVCLRSPIEVYKSLQKRGANSKSFGLSLWRTYAISIFENIQGSPHIVTSYRNYLFQPLKEISRLINFAGVPLTTDEIHRKILRVVKPSLSSQEDSLTEFFEMPNDVKALYVNFYRQANQEFDDMATNNNETTIDSHLANVYLHEKEQQAQMLTAQAKEFSSQIKELSAQVDEKEKIIQLLTAQLKEIQSGRAWRFVQILQRTRYLFKRSVH